MNTSYTTNVTSCISSISQTKEIPTGLFPVMSTGINNYQFSNSTGDGSSVLLTPSPPPIPKYTIPMDPNNNSTNFNISQPYTSSLSRLDEQQNIPNNVNSSHLRNDIFDSTSGREDWTEDGEPCEIVQMEPDTGSQSTRLFSGAASEASTEIGNDKIGRDYIGSLDIIVTVCLALVSLLSPILMVSIPKVPGIAQMRLKKQQQYTTQFQAKFILKGSDKNLCNNSCESSLVFLGVKLVILSVAALLLFCRRRTYSFPRILIFKVVLLTILFVIIFVFWVFYVLRILLSDEVIEYENVVIYATNVADILIFTHYLSVVMLEIRHLETRFCIKVTRSPDGESKYYLMGNMSIQTAAVKILQHYVIDFPMYNSHTRHRPSSFSRDFDFEIQPNTNFKKRTMITDVDNFESDNHPRQPRQQHQQHQRPQTHPLAHQHQQQDDRYSGSSAVGEGSNRRQSPSARHQRATSRSIERFPRSFPGPRDMNVTSFREKLYREMELEKRLKKRRLRLLASAEEAFSNLRRLPNKDTDLPDRADYSNKVISSTDAANSVLAQLAKPFQKYLKMARLQSQFPRNRIENHLSRCLQFGLSAQSFLESLIGAPRVIESAENVDGQQWMVICSQSLCRGLSNNLTFVMRRENISLLCVVQHIPLFSLLEDIVDKRNPQRFLIKFDSETSV